MPLFREAIIGTVMYPCQCKLTILHIMGPVLRTNKLSGAPTSKSFAVLEPVDLSVHFNKSCTTRTNRNQELALTSVFSNTFTP